MFSIQSFRSERRLIRSEIPRSCSREAMCSNMAEIIEKPKLFRGVAWVLNQSVSRSVRSARTLLWVLSSLVLLGGPLQGAPFREVAPPTYGKKKAPPAPKPLTADELLFEDGDRVRGKFIEQEGDVLVFKSDRFGLLRVPAGTAKLTLAHPPASEAGELAAQEDEEAEVDRSPFSPHAMAAALKDFFGDWHGRFSVAAEMMNDSAEHNSATVDARVGQRWAADEVQLTGRWDYATVDENTPSTDMIKGSGFWRHDFESKLFTAYRPTVEWNRAYYRAGIPQDYVLLQQELGVGVTLVDTEARSIRVGVAENLFDTWILPTDNHVSQTVESVFAEVEARLPWRIVITDRGVYYYSFANETTGWENRFEISKKLTETLTMGLRHEVRYNNPDVRSEDYRRLRLLFGIDF